MGFGAEVTSKDKKKFGEVLRSILPEDLLRFGLIPEFVGRLPVIVTLDALDEEALIRILLEPKNALVKQYQKFLEMDNVQLEFKEDALRSIAAEALKRNTGARGLRAIIEGIMRNVMYEVPSRTDITKCTVTKEVVLNKEEPILVTSELSHPAKICSRSPALLPSSSAQQGSRVAVERESKKEVEKLQRMREISLTEPLAEKTRPSTFAEIVGQEEGLKALRAALCGPNPQHVLIYGPPGVGKTAAARLILEEAKRNPFSPFCPERQIH
ncbi:hypothetical protein Lal_00008047 [Lupinus albus]|nr:hypothetical protein Lal_00008047 [Lupinus albus]